MKHKLKEILENKKILILGFGKEGKSTFKLIRKIIPLSHITIADKNESAISRNEFRNLSSFQLVFGASYLDNLHKYDLIIKSPGIPNHLFPVDINTDKITSQTELFLRLYSKQVIGITGTKGKSTTSSLVFHILSSYFDDVIFVGNIGVPAFEMLDRINENTKIVFELSGHQLSDISVSPHFAVILNLFQEHLDHFGSFQAYQNAKFNIFRFQKEEDYLIYNLDNHLILHEIEKSVPANNLIPFSLERKTDKGMVANINDELIYENCPYQFKNRTQLPGRHNLLNIMAAFLVGSKMGIPAQEIIDAILSFRGLAHRLEYFGEFKGIYFYNDSIATIPESVIEALKTLMTVDTLILGGKDRGIDYDNLIDYLPISSVRNIIFIGEAGKRIFSELEEKKANHNIHLHFIQQFNDMRNIILKNTKPGKICLLSPAASSYDMFSSFEERGDAFRKIAENL